MSDSYVKFFGIILGALLVLASVIMFLISFMLGQIAFMHNNILTSAIGMIGQIGSTYLMFSSAEFIKDIYYS